MYNNLFINVSNLDRFKQELSLGNIPDYSIVFINKEKLIWVRGNYYSCSYTSEDIERLIQEAIKDKQDKLISGVNIKTINGQSLLGQGNLVIEGGSGSILPTIGFAGFTDIEAETSSMKYGDPTSVYFSRTNKCFILKEDPEDDETFHLIWENSDLWNDKAGTLEDEPYRDKYYFYDGSLYVWNGTDLVEYTKLIDVVQTIGDSTSKVMSQKAVTDELNKRYETIEFAGILDSSVSVEPPSWLKVNGDSSNVYFHEGKKAFVIKHTDNKYYTEWDNSTLWNTESYKAKLNCFYVNHISKELYVFNSIKLIPITSSGSGFKEVDFSNIDSLDSIEDCGYYSVITMEHNCGALIVTSDHAAHGIMQFLISNYQIENGVVDGRHSDGTFTIVCRFKKLSGSWSVWSYFGINDAVATDFYSYSSNKVKSELDVRYITLKFAGISEETPDLNQPSADTATPDKVYYMKNHKVFAYKKNDTYFTTFVNTVIWNIFKNGSLIAKTDTYFIDNNGIQYIFDGTDLKPTGKYEGGDLNGRIMGRINLTKGTNDYSELDNYNDPTKAGKYTIYSPDGRMIGFLNLYCAWMSYIVQELESFKTQTDATSLYYPTRYVRSKLISSGSWTAWVPLQKFFIGENEQIGDKYTVPSMEMFKELSNRIDESGGIVVDSALSTTSINPVQNKVITAEINRLLAAVFPLKITVSGGGLFEKGTSKNITISWVVKEGDTTVTADSTTINGTPVTGTSKTYNGVTTTTTYTVKVTKDGISAQGSTTATFIAPMYFGFAQASQVGSLSITALSKQTIKSNPAGSYTLNNPTSGYYLWLCVPNSMTINKVTSSGFDVPMEVYQSGNTSIDSYKCYRSSNSINSGEMNIVIS